MGVATLGRATISKLYQKFNPSVRRKQETQAHVKRRLASVLAEETQETPEWRTPKAVPEQPAIPAPTTIDEVTWEIQGVPGKEYRLMHPVQEEPVRPSRFLKGSIYKRHMRDMRADKLTPYNFSRTKQRAKRLDRMARVLFTGRNEAIMTVKQAANYFGVSQSTVLRDTAYLRKLMKEDIYFRNKASFTVEDRHAYDNTATLPAYQKTERLALPQPKQDLAA